jgi:hypothetical protein
MTRDRDVVAFFFTAGFTGTGSVSAAFLRARGALGFCSAIGSSLLRS